MECIEWKCAFAVATCTGFINGTSTFGERYNAWHHKLPIKSYHHCVPMFRSAIAQLVPNYGEFPVGSEFSFGLVCVYMTKGKSNSRLNSPR